MNLESTGKPAAVAQLAGLLATAAANAQCTQAVWLSGEGFQRLPNDTLAPSAWDKLRFESARTPEQSFAILPPKFRRLGLRVLISDLLWPGEPLQVLRRLRESAAALFVVQLLAREDVQPLEHGNIRVVDSETGEETEVYVDAGIARQYAGNLAHLQQSWADGCRQCGAHMTTMIAEDVAKSISELESIQLLVPAWGGRDKSGGYAAREAQKSSKRPERMQQRKAIIALAPRTDQRMPDCLRRSPMTVRQPASTTPEPTKNFLARYSA